MNGPAFGRYDLHDRLTDVRRRHPHYTIIFDKVQRRWRADSKNHVIVEETLDDLEETLDRENPMKGAGQ
jgi:hypothetical protein